MADSPQPIWPWRRPVNPVTRGAFIVVEGLDRAGKTTQVKRLCDALYSQGHNVKTIRFPDRTSPIGKMIDGYLQSKTEMDDHAIHLLFSANRNWIEQTIADGYTIVCDRFYYSGMVYSAAKENPALSLEWARTSDHGLPRPDVVVFLDLETEDAEKRGGFGEEKYEKKEMQLRVRKLFLELRQLNRDEAEDMIIMDAGAAIESVGDEILHHVQGLVGAIANDRERPLRRVQPW